MKIKVLTIAALPPTSYIALLIYNYTFVACYTASLTTVTALLEYLNLDCSVRVSQIIDARGYVSGTQSIFLTNFIFVCDEKSDTRETLTSKGF